MRGINSYLLGKPEGNQPLGRPVLKLERNIKNRFTLLKPTHALISKHSFTFTLKH
jgi:hypothetical protein